ncbi:alpha/beta hydrolase [Lentisphaerota bacterium ZTH]|nr:alpha/beta hydrolase [Lentisphaerota bacterium]WET05697.1 alpha/beta hydrolase [Lentisphaerota bacterium ZTH]
MNTMSYLSKFFKTNDGVKLHYIEAGKGKPLIMLPGWSQTAEQYKYQIEKLSSSYRVIALDYRGHGDSEKPDYGYRMSRLAVDLHNLLTELELNDVNLLGHSMGCCVIWSYWDLFGGKQLSKLIFVDETPFNAFLQVSLGKEAEQFGILFTLENLFEVVKRIRNDYDESYTRELIGKMFPHDFPKEQIDWIIQQNCKMPRNLAADLLYETNIALDWRDVVKRINIPVLIIGARDSQMPWRSQVWLHEHISDSRLEIFEKEEGGRHFMFIENPEKFNHLVADFIG